ncbi:PAS domain-containing protein [Henriciella marina]|uniref:PAS domain-containing protein n=1 Tax=Henriciella marina TaxID=453851 RepID=A0ABT4LYD2_9PROT|nr:PAS domain-containing protein [Henriciella marina]MCZ4299341.1 PAS domain-containing protein [Henriciella marina]
MLDRTLHPNSQTLLSAWQRMSIAASDVPSGPTTKDHPDLIERLFVIQQEGDDQWLFRTAGVQLQSSLGRELADHDFLGVWTGHDRDMLSSLLKIISREKLPGIVRARGESLTGERVDIEMTLAPLAKPPHIETGARMLGLYQALGGETFLRGRPVWRHRLTAIYPPDARTKEPRLKLVASND